METQKNNDSGFTLIEILVSVVILGIGILGVLSLQSRALMDNQDAYIRTQAILLTYDMSDRIRANSKIWRNKLKDDKLADITIADPEGNNATGKYYFCSAYDPNGTLGTTLNTPNECSDLEMAQYDVYRWIKDVDTVLKAGTVTINKVPDNNTNPPTDVIQLTVTWDRLNQDIQKKLGNASYRLKVRP